MKHNKKTKKSKEKQEKHEEGEKEGKQKTKAPKQITRKQIANNLHVFEVAFSHMHTDM